MIKKIVSITSFLIFLSALSSWAQLYKSALGIRIGDSQGINYKTFVASKNAVEGILTIDNGGFGITGLYEIHGTAFSSRDFNWYIGGGGHLYSYGNGYYHHNNGLVVGLDGIIGIEGKIRSIPLAIGLDWKPAFNIINASSLHTNAIGLSVRYCF